MWVITELKKMTQKMEKVVRIDLHLVPFRNTFTLMQATSFRVNQPVNLSENTAPSKHNLSRILQERNFRFEFEFEFD